MIVRFEKLNLVTTDKGDHLQCPKGHKFWWQPIVRPNNCPKCQKKLKKTTKDVMSGCWSGGEASPCETCGETQILVPREGHPNSKYWDLEQDDGMKLYACETCKEVE